MRLTATLLYYVHHRGIPGAISIGKHRKLRVIKDRHRWNAVQDMIREEQNIALLSNPYLTKEEDAVYIQMEKAKEAAAFRDEIVANRILRMPKHRTTLQELEHLNVSKGWD